MKKGFTLVELLVVIGILGILMSVLVVSLRSAPQKAEMAKCSELVQNTKVALTKIFDENGFWPQVLISNNNSDKGLDATAAYPLRNLMSLSYNSDSKKLTKLNKFGIVTPWAEQYIKNNGSSCSETDEVPTVGGTIADHRLRYALSLDGSGSIKNVTVASTIEIENNDEASQSVDIRAIAAVWCRGPRGEFIRSWTDGETQGVN